MLLISLSLIGLIAIISLLGVNKTEVVPIPVRVNETKNNNR